MTSCIQSRKNSRRTRRRGGFTLVEVSIALTLTAIIGVCIAMMMMSVSAGTTGQQDGRDHLTRIAALQSRLTTQIHSCSAVLAAGTGYVVYWTGNQAAGNPITKTVHLSEIRLVQLTSNNQLVSYAKAPGAADQQYANSTNWYSAAQAAVSNGGLVGTAIANNVTAFNSTATNTVATDAHEVIFKITLSDAYTTRNACFAASIRAQTSPI